MSLKIDTTVSTYAHTFEQVRELYAEVLLESITSDVSTRLATLHFTIAASGLITCQDLQSEHVDMRVIDCIDDCCAIIDVGSARSLIPWRSALDTDQG